jgi:acetylornithine deacetylase/succinyl-diaminopimelate desuccinylase-like protein
MRWRIPLLILAVGVIAVSVLIVYSRRTQNDIDSQLWIPKKATITPEVARLQRYVRVDTTNPPGNEIAGARYLASLLKEAGVEAEIIESAPARGNLYARIRGKQPGEGLLLLNHIDVVAADPKYWTKPPFAAELRFDQLYGRGTLDMKGIAMCELEAFLDVARSKRQPERDLVFLATADEETGGSLGLEWLLAHRPDVIDGIRYAINEGGITEAKQESISYFGIETGSKMVVRMILRAPSREAMQKTRAALEPFITPQDPERLLPEVREFLHSIAPQRVEQRQFLDDVAHTIAAGKFWLLQRGYKELMQNIIWLGGVESDARGATMAANLYNLPDENPDARIEWLRSRVAPFGATIDKVIEKSGPAPLSTPHTPMFALIAREVARQYPGIPIGTEILATSYNDSRHLRARGIQSYGLSPYPVDYYQTQGIHGIDERIRVAWYMQGVSVMRKIVAAYAFEALSATVDK